MQLNRLVVLIGLTFVLSCTNSNNERVVVDFDKARDADQNIDNNTKKEVYIAIASMTSPKETFIYYGDLIKYISQKVGHPIFIKQKKTYEEVNMLLEDSEVDFAFICSGAFVDEYKKRKIKILVAPKINNDTHYHAYLIAGKDGQINSFKDFENKSFAFTDPLSNTGRLYPEKKLAELGRDENEFFLKTVYTYGHDISIQMVNRGIIDGASVHGLIFDYLSEHQPEKVKNIKIIEESEKFGIPPVVTPSSLSKQKFNEYRQIFLNMHNDSSGREILNKLNIDKFVVVNNKLYKSVFQLKKFTDNANKK